MGRGRNENSKQGSPGSPPLGSLLGRQAGQPASPGWKPHPPWPRPSWPGPHPQGGLLLPAPHPPLGRDPGRPPAHSPGGLPTRPGRGATLLWPWFAHQQNGESKTSLEKHSQARRVHLITIINSSTAHGRYQAPALAVRDERSPCAPPGNLSKPAVYISPE